MKKGLTKRDFDDVNLWIEAQPQEHAGERAAQGQSSGIEERDQEKG